MHAYQQFVKEHFHSMPGATAAEKMKACAAAYRKMKEGKPAKPKGKGKGKGKGGILSMA
jgi:hypothetical protein